MADENKPAFYPRVGNIKAKNFKSAQPMPFIEDPRAMELPRFGEDSDQFGRVDVGVASQQNLELGRRMVERENQLRRQREADRSPLEKLAGGLQAGRLIGSGLVQSVASIPTAITKGSKAAEDYIAENMYKPTQPLAYEYAGDIGDFLEKLETEYKIPPVLPEAMALQYLTGPATAQAARAAGKGAVKAGMALERSMEPVVKGALERGGLPREMVMAMGANTQSNVVKPYGGNWLGGEDQLAIPERDLRRLKDSRGIQPDALKQLEADLAEISALPNAAKKHDFVIRQMQDEIDRARIPNAINNWIDSNLKNYVKKEMGTPDDPVRKLAEEGIIHMPLRDDLDRMEYLQDIRKAEGYPAEGMGKSELAKQWENLSDDAIRVSKAGNIQEQANTGAKLEKARAELEAHKKQIDDDFIALLKDRGGLTEKDREVFDKFPNFQKAEILGDTKYKELQGNINDLLAQEQGFEKRAGELNPFVAKLDPNTRLYSGSTYDLGFDHIIDVLKEDLGTGRIRPEQLNKVSMEQAVRRTYEYDQELAKKMNEARMTSRAELPVYKEYPEGLKWVELNRPGDFAAESDAMGHSVRGYEPPESHPDWTKSSGEEGHSSYGIGGWEAIKSGRAKVYSLVDAKGEPHVTIEVEKNTSPYFRATQRSKLANKGMSDEEIESALQNMPAQIKQIKGKQNAKPKEQYLPFVQDFVKGGNWSDIGDFRNTGLIREGGKIMTPAEHADWLLKELGADTYNELGLGGTPPAGMKRGGKVSISNNPDTMMIELGNKRMKKGGSEDDTKPYFGGAGTKKYAAAKKRAEQGDVNTLRDPKTYAAVAGLMGERPDEMGFSVLHPDYQAIKDVAEPAFGLGIAAQAYPLIGPLTKGLPVGASIKNVTPMKASEALGKIEGRPLKITQADRTKVGGGYLGGPGFSGLQLTEPEYRAAEAAWAVQNAGTAKTILGGGGDNAVYAAMLGTPTQHQSNQMVFDKLLGDFKKAAKRGELTPELRDLINMRLAAAVDNKGNPVFPANVDIMDKKFRDVADTFSRRSIAGHLMGGVQVGGKKGQIIDYDKIIRNTTDPDLLDQPTGALGNRLFTLSGGIVQRPDLHPAFPTILQGEDLGVMFTPVERDIVMKDFVEKTMREKGRKPGYMDYTRGNPPTQLITEDILTELQKLGKKKGGAVHKAEGGEVSGDDLILEERPL
jgi:hypothetical protein